MIIDPVFDPSVTVSLFWNGYTSTLRKSLLKIWLVLSLRLYLESNLELVRRWLLLGFSDSSYKFFIG